MSALKICPQCGTEYELDQRFCPKDGSTLRSQSSAEGDLVGAVIADRYHVMKKLGEGGMGTVYLAEHVKMGRKSAIKVMNSGMVGDADAISRFNREATNASQINHPNVAAIYDFGETTDGLIYMAMEFIEGPSLTKVIEDAGSLPPLRAADITRQASDALAVAHDMGIVHRDLKPDNIMLTKNRDGSDCVKVVDFGIAKAAGNDAQKVTKTGLVVGTPEYMSPEQLAGDKLDGRSDLYSLGLVAFNMLTGSLPFPADSVQESMIKRLTEEPKRLAEIKPDVAWSPDVQAVLDRALARDAVDRYQSAAEFGRELYKAVQLQDAGSEGTAVMQAPVVPASAGKPTPKTPKHAVPPTRVSAATPISNAVVKEPARSKTPMIAVAAVVVVGLGIGAFAILKPKSAQTASPNAPTSTQQANGSVVTPSGDQAQGAGATVEIDALLDSLEKVTDLSKEPTTVTADHALERLKTLPPATKLTADQKVLAAMIRARAEVTRGNNRNACLAVQDVEGDSKGTKYEKSVKFILTNAC